MTRTVAVVGLGKIGASMVAAFASRGFSVIGVDIDPGIVECVDQGRAPVQETNLPEYLADHRDRIRATTSFQTAVHAADVTFVIVPTPSDREGAFSLHYAASACEEIGRALATHPRFHTVVLTSTVLPGATRFGLLPILERASGRRAGRDFGLCYSPEFIALGSVIQDLLSPDFTLVGEFDPRSGDLLEEVYSRFVLNGAPCRRMSLENAELTKLAVNTFVTMKISFANMLGELCEGLPGGDVDAVTDALGSDSRIGPSYLKAAMSFGGPCFPRDTVALGYLASALDGDGRLARITGEFNREFLARQTQWVRSRVQGKTTIAVLGLAYKPHSHVIDESPGVQLANALVGDEGVTVVAYDPLAAESAKARLDAEVEILTSSAECLERADLVLIVNPDPDFARLTIQSFGSRDSLPTVVDYWRVVAPDVRAALKDHYVAFGRAPRDPALSDRLVDLWSLPVSPVPPTP